MKILIPSKGRPLSIKTHWYLDNGGVTDYQIILHNEAERASYLANPTIRPETLVVSGQPYGISLQRQWMIENLVKGGEWFLTLDDNIDRFTGVRRESYEQAELPVERGDFDRSIYNHNLTATEFLARLELDRKHCEATGIHYAGMAVVDNYYFRSVKYRYVGYVISKAAMIHNVGVPYDPNVTAMDDYAFTAEHLKRFGKVLINNYLFPVAGHYEPGGIGTYQERQPAKIKDSEYLMRKYPGLFRYKSKKGCHPKAELQVRFTTLSQVESWRTGFF